MILKQADEAMLKARAIAGKLETELRVGDWPLGTGRVMPELLRAYQRAMPDVHVSLHDWSLTSISRAYVMAGCSLRSQFFPSRGRSSLSSGLKN